jgi:hypothetical protein
VRGGRRHLAVLLGRRIFVVRVTVHLVRVHRLGRGQVMDQVNGAHQTIDAKHEGRDQERHQTRASGSSPA